MHTSSVCCCQGNTGHMTSFVPVSVIPGAGKYCSVWFKPYHAFKAKATKHNTLTESLLSVFACFQRFCSTRTLTWGVEFSTSKHEFVFWKYFIQIVPDDSKAFLESKTLWQIGCAISCFQKIEISIDHKCVLKQMSLKFVFFKIELSARQRVCLM